MEAWPLTSPKVSTLISFSIFSIVSSVSFVFVQPIPIWVKSILHFCWLPRQIPPYFLFVCFVLTCIFPNNLCSDYHTMNRQNEVNRGPQRLNWLQVSLKHCSPLTKFDLYKGLLTQSVTRGDVISCLCYEEERRAADRPGCCSWTSLNQITPALSNCDIAVKHNRCRDMACYYLQWECLPARTTG